MTIDSQHIIIGNATDVGRIRDHNEDYMSHFKTPFGYCVLVCDGMGGHAAGEEASRSAASAIKQYLQDDKNEAENVLVAIRNSIEFANFKLRELSQKNPSLKGMGTTCVMAMIDSSKMYIAHAGDSRMYLFRKNKIKQITKDHSTVQNLIDSGVLTEEEAEKSDKKNQITKAIGVFDKVEPSVSPEPVKLIKGDKIVLCTDGLTGHLSREKIKEVIKNEPDVQQAALQLIENANNNGGSDNITVQIVHYTGKSILDEKKQQRKKKKIIPVVIIVIGLVLAIGVMAYKNIISGNLNPFSSGSTVVDSTDSISHQNLRNGIHDSLKNQKQQGKLSKNK